MSGGSTRGRVARADDKNNDLGADSEKLDSPKNCQTSANVASQGQGNGSGDGSSSPSGGSGSGGSSGSRRGHNSDDMDGLSSGNDSGERESEGGMERGNGSRGRQSTRSSHSSSNGKDSGMMLETTESNKRCKTHKYTPCALKQFKWIECVSRFNLTTFSLVCHNLLQSSISF